MSLLSGFFCTFNLAVQGSTQSIQSIKLFYIIDNATYLLLNISTKLLNWLLACFGHRLLPTWCLVKNVFLTKFLRSNLLSADSRKCEHVLSFRFVFQFGPRLVALFWGNWFLAKSQEMKIAKILKCTLLHYPIYPR